MSKSQQLCANYPIAIVVLVVVVLLTELLLRLLQYPNFVNPDCAYQLVTAKQILEGSQPFSDFVVTSQPIWFYLNTLTWYISSGLNVSVQTTWILLNWLMIFVAAVMSGVVISQARTDRENDWLALGCILSSFLLLHLSLTYHVGQKEVVFMSAYFPFFLVRWQRWQGHSPAAFVAIACALMCTIIVFVEPALILIPLAVEIGFFFTRPRHLANGPPSDKALFKQILHAPEVPTVVLTAVTLFIGSWLIPNQQEYYLRWLPLLVDGHQVYGQSWNRLLWLVASDGELVASRLLVGVICIAAFVLRRRSSFFMPLLLWTISAWLIYIVQGSGDAHRTIPFVFGFFLIAGIECVLLSQALLSKIVANRMIVNLSSKSASGSLLLNDPQKKSFFVLMLFGVILLPVLPLLVRNSMVTTKIISPLDKAVMGSTSPGDRVLILGTTSTSSYPLLLNLNRKPGSRFGWSFALDMVFYARLNSKSDRNWGLEQSKIVNDLVEDIGRLQPKLIAIEALPATIALSGSLYERLAHQRLFVRALGNYEPAGICNGYAVWLPRRKSIEPRVPTSNLPDISSIR